MVKYGIVWKDAEGWHRSDPMGKDQARAEMAAKAKVAGVTKVYFVNHQMSVAIGFPED